MAHLISHLADLTALRDRFDLDRTIVAAVHEALAPVSVDLYRFTEAFGEPVWTCRATSAKRQRAGDPPRAGSRANRAPVVDHRDREDCLVNARIVAARSPRPRTLFPVITSREVVGVLEVASTLPFDEAQLALVSAVLRLYKGFHDLLDHSERDPLTGLLNRQTFDASFMQRIALSSAPAPAPAPDANDGDSPDERATWLGVIDIDFFKKVNDNFGHLIGDEVLLVLARILQNSFRLEDLLYRFGGEEFVVVLQDLTPAQAAAAFERLRSRVEAFSFPQVGKVTVSIGIAKAVCDHTPSESFGRADKALYHAKKNGRNQVVNHEALEAPKAPCAHQGEIELF